MLLTADRLDVLAGERLHAVLVVGPSMVSILAQGGIDHLRHQLEDVGFQDARLFVDRPSSWHLGAGVPRPDAPEWLVFAELLPAQTASLQRQLTEDLRVADAWDVRLDDTFVVTPFHPYAVDACASARFAGASRAFATAYAMEALRC